MGVENKLAAMLCIGCIVISTSLSGQCDRQTAINDYNNFLNLDYDLADLAWNGDTSICSPGSIDTLVQQKILDKINYYRKLCDLNDDVVFDSLKSSKCQESALMQMANNSLSHCSGTNNTPCDTWVCNTSNAIQASQSANIASANWDNYDVIDLYMEDSGANNTHVGHRRWILFSKAQVFGNGMTDNRNTLWVFGNSGNPYGNNRDYIAYPPGDFIVQDLVYDRWSFGIPGGDFTNANVQMTDSNGNSVALSIIYNSSVGYGDYSIVWEPVGVNTTDSIDLSYNVTVSNIGGNAPLPSYSYTVDIIPSIYPPNCIAGMEWDSTTCSCITIPVCPDSLMVDDSAPLIGYYEADSIIMSYGTVMNSDTATFMGGHEITLDPGFEVSAGAEFTATIDTTGCANSN